MMSIPTQDQILNFEMPTIKVGAPVSFYPTGQAEGQYPQLAFVVRISRSGRNVMLRNVNGQINEAVRNIEDPKLQLNSDHRENGAWDFTDEEKRIRTDREELLERVERLETALTPKPRPGKSDQ
jgi:hypothetical protein